MLDSSRMFRTLKYSVLILLFVFIVAFLDGPSTRDKYAQVLRTFKDEKRLFVADYLEDEIDGKFDGSELAKLCARKTWHPEHQALILSCHPVKGGIGEVKNGHLQCIRFAIEIGAQLVLPRITRRSPADITNLDGEQQAKGQPIDYMFSSEHLVTSLRNSCPQMKIHRSLDDLYDKPSLLKPLSVNLHMLTDQFSSIEGTLTPTVTDPNSARIKFNELYERELPLERRRYPIRVELQTLPFIWPAGHDGEEFWRDFGRLLRVREDVRTLAASGLYNLAKRFGFPIDPRRRIGAASNNDNNNKNNNTATKLVGVHLRTEADAMYGMLGFPDYESQSPYFLDYLEEAAGDGQARVVYLATGLLPGDDDVRRFRARAAELNATVVTKRDVLGPGEVAVLNNRMTWDQRALVDYEIMLRAGTVLGVVESGFAWNLALRRANAYGGGGDGSDGGGGGAANSGEPSGYLGLADLSSLSSDQPEDLIMWMDPYSRLYGRAARAVSIFHGTWA